MAYLILPPEKPIYCEPVVEGSKSIANRLLVMQALCGPAFALSGLPVCEDTQVMRAVLERLQEKKGHYPDPVLLDCRQAGTVMRFLTAVAAVTPGNWLLTGSNRLKERPIGPLVEALQQAGARVRYAEKEGFPPLLVEGGPVQGREVSIDAGISSQFISALLMVAPMMKYGLRLSLTGERVSAPYTRMTTGLMEQAGIKIEEKENTYIIHPQAYAGGIFTPEPDWSSASYWYEIAALADQADIFLPGFRLKSLQGDAEVSHLFESLGVFTEFNQAGIHLTKKAKMKMPDSILMTAQPDLVPALAVALAGLRQRCRITGIRHLRIKESDRIQCLADGLAISGYEAITEEDALHISGNCRSRAEAGVILTRKDHRIAMAFAPLCLKTGEIRIDETAVVEKSYPGFWRDLEKAGFRVESPRK